VKSFRKRIKDHRFVGRSVIFVRETSGSVEKCLGIGPCENCVTSICDEVEIPKGKVGILKEVIRYRETQGYDEPEDEEYWSDGQIYTIVVDGQALHDFEWKDFVLLDGWIRKHGKEGRNDSVDSVED